jgi:hypothetical protein
MVFFHHYSHLQPIAESGNAVALEPNAAPIPTVEVARQRLTQAFMMDVAKSQFFRPEFVDPYLGTGIGRLLYRHVLKVDGDWLLPTVKLESVISGLLGQQTPADLDLRVRGFEAMVAAEAFDSYYCNQWGSFEEARVKKVAEGSYETQAEALQILNAQLNTRQMMKALFPRSELVFATELAPLIERINVGGATAAKQSLGLVDADNGLPDDPSQRNPQADTVSRVRAAAYTIDRERAIARDVVTSQYYMSLKPLQQAYEERQSEVSRIVGQADLLDRRVMLANAGISGRDALPKNFFSSNKQTVDILPNRAPSPFLMPGRQENFLLNGVRAQPENLVNVMGSYEAASIVARSVNGEKISEQERQMMNSLIAGANSERQQLALRLDQTVRPLEDAHREIARDTPAYIESILPEYQRRFSSQRAQVDTQKEMGAGKDWMTSGIAKSLDSYGVDGANIYDAQALRTQINRYRDPDIVADLGSWATPEERLKKWQQDRDGYGRSVRVDMNRIAQDVAANGSTVGQLESLYETDKRMAIEGKRAVYSPIDGALTKFSMGTASVSWVPVAGQIAGVAGDLADGVNAAGHLMYTGDREQAALNGVSAIPLAGNIISASAKSAKTGEKLLGSAGTLATGAKSWQRAQLPVTGAAMGYGGYQGVNNYLEQRAQNEALNARLEKINEGFRKEFPNERLLDPKSPAVTAFQGAAHQQMRQEQQAAAAAQQQLVNPAPPSKPSSGAAQSAMKSNPL